MSYLKRKDTRYLLKQIAKRDGKSLNEVLEEFRLNIEDMKNSDDLDERTLYKKLFGNKTPIPEEYIEKMPKYAMKGVHF